MPSNNSIRSEEVNDIMTDIPKWIIRWGISLIFAIILCFVFVSWLIKYPDVIQGKTKIVSCGIENNIYSKISGELIDIKFNDNEFVKEGDLIGVIKNPLNINAKNYLLDFLYSIEHLDISNIDLDNANKYVFGGLQNDYTKLIGYIGEYQSIVKKSNASLKVANLSSQLNNNLKLKELTEKQLELSFEQVKREKYKLDVDRGLFEEKVLSKAEFERQRLSYENSLNENTNLKKSLYQSSIVIIGIEQEIQDLTFNEQEKFRQLKFSITEQVSVLKNLINVWEEDYEIKSPASGKLVFLEDYNLNDYVEMGKKLFVVIPENSQHKSIVYVPKYGVGKLALNQEVKIKLDNFPYQEYGQLTGVVSSIAELPKDDFYQVEVKLSNSSITTYKKQVLLKSEMSGTAEIITQDVRLLNRIFNKLKGAID